MAVAPLAPSVLQVALESAAKCEALTASAAAANLKIWTSELTALMHEIFIGEILPHVRSTSPMAALFSDWKVPCKEFTFETELRHEV